MHSIVGRRIMMNNIKDFFSVVDSSWGIRSVSFKEGAIHLKSGFLLPLARFFATYKNFWDADKRFVVSADWRRKLATWPIHDPLVVQSVGNSHLCRIHLVGLIADFMNSGKRVNKLIPFKQADAHVTKDQVA